MTGKKKKFNSRFPPARIKKMMQSDEDVGKVAWVVPCLISKALEIFSEQLMITISEQIQSREARTLSTDHIKAAIKLKGEFIAVRELADADHPAGHDSAQELGSAGENNDAEGHSSPKKRKCSADDEPALGLGPAGAAVGPRNSQPDEPPKKRGRGRPRKDQQQQQQVVSCPVTSSGNKSSVTSFAATSRKGRSVEFEDDDDDDDEDDDDDDDEDYR